MKAFGLSIVPFGTCFGISLGPLIFWMKVFPDMSSDRSQLSQRLTKYDASNESHDSPTKWQARGGACTANLRMYAFPDPPGVGRRLMLKGSTSRVSLVQHRASAEGID